MFFFEKKNQKTFASSVDTKWTKVFCFFFSKKKILAYLHCAARPGQTSLTRAV